jgi:hypothetical protein
MDEFRQFGSIISVTTDAILARCISLYELAACNLARLPMTPETK